MKKIDSYFKNIKSDDFKAIKLRNKYIKYNAFTLLISDSYSIIAIKLNIHDKNSINLFENIKANYEEMQEGILKNSIIKFYEKFLSGGYDKEIYNFQEVTKDSKKLLENENITISKTFYNKILSIIGTAKKQKRLFINGDRKVINIISKYGHAFLLGIRTY